MVSLSVPHENLLLVSSQITFWVEASQSVRPAPSKEETQREAPEAEPSQTRVPEEVRESWAWRIRPEAVFTTFSPVLVQRPASVPEIEKPRTRWQARTILHWHTNGPSGLVPMRFQK